MQTEIEAKWLNVDVEYIRKKLVSIGAVLVHPERLMTRRAYDFADMSLETNQRGWVRVRNEGEKVTLSYKQVDDRSLHGTKEITVIVNDFETTCNFLESIGLKSKSYQETKRESWKLGDTEIEIDTWPWIPTFIEIESSSESELRDVAGKLDLDYSKALFGSVEPAYQAVYDIEENDINRCKEILFGDVPEWLQVKKIKN